LFFVPVNIWTIFLFCDCAESNKIQIVNLVFSFRKRMESSKMLSHEAEFPLNARACVRD